MSRARFAALALVAAATLAACSAPTAPAPRPDAPSFNDALTAEDSSSLSGYQVGHG